MPPAFVNPDARIEEAAGRSTLDLEQNKNEVHPHWSPQEELMLRRLATDAFELMALAAFLCSVAMLARW